MIITRKYWTVMYSLILMAWKKKAKKDNDRYCKSLSNGYLYINLLLNFLCDAPAILCRSCYRSGQDRGSSVSSVDNGYSTCDSSSPSSSLPSATIITTTTISASHAIMEKLTCHDLMCFSTSHSSMQTHYLIKTGEEIQLTL
mmetsp:Transcript_22252/g.48307  ORF Transcript_22252/g.48307 Transcript_22252/m.48307 type:complete len:142 (-) Transcript_22252:2978-3403(-)